MNRFADDAYNKRIMNIKLELNYSYLYENGQNSY